jgi:hypothetical protein
MYWSSVLAHVTLSTLKRKSNCLVKSRVVEVKVACLSQRQCCQVVACCMLHAWHALHACLVACCMHAWHVHAKSRVSCNWSLKSSSIFELKCEVELCQACLLPLIHAIYFSYSCLYKQRSSPLLYTIFICRLRVKHIEAHISETEATYQRSKSVL